MLFKCTKNFYMSEQFDNELSFSKGTVYDFADSGDGWMLAIDDAGDSHNMDIFEDMWKHFEPINSWEVK
jgi:hypothetical protein